MLGSINFEQQQAEFTNRALYGDLQGKVPITEKDRQIMNMYSQYNTTPQGYANEYRKATELSYVPRAQLEQVKAQRAAEMGIQPPSSYAQATPLYPQNPVMNGYRDFGNPYQNLAYNPYAGTNFYSNSYYNPFGYQQQPQVMIDHNNPIINFAVSKIMQMSDYQDYYGTQNYYNTPDRTVRIDFNKQFNEDNTIVSHLPPEIKENMNRYFASMGIDVSNDSNDTDWRNGRIIEVPVVGLSQNTPYGYPSYYNNYTSYQMQNSLPPYCRTKQFQDYLEAEKKKQQEFQEAITRDIFRITGNDYDEFTRKMQEKKEEDAKRQIKNRHRYDSFFNNESDEAKKLYEDMEDNMNKVLMNISINPYHYTVSFDDVRDNCNKLMWNEPNIQKARQEMPWNASAIDFWTKYYPQYENRKIVDRLRYLARKGQMDYDSNKYREAITRSGINSQPYLGFAAYKPVYNPVTGQQSTITPIDSITQKYNERRQNYIMEANKRGGIV